jgi:valine--pyruvate aminotransferase
MERSSTSLTTVGEKMSSLSGVRAITRDTVETLARTDGDRLTNLSAGNPTILPEVEEMWRGLSRGLIDGPDFGDVVCRYGASQGYEPLLDAVVDWFNSNYGWGITRCNVLVTPGSQALYFFATNCFGGYGRDGRLRKIVLPLSPDYTGYEGMLLDEGVLRSHRPSVEILPGHRFKYRPTLERLEIGEGVGAVLFSRPSNPTGNVLTDAEVGEIVQMAAARDVPVVVDAAYSSPFPNLVYTEMAPVWAENVIHCMSLSKAGLPGERVGIAVGDERHLAVLESFQSNANIMSSRYGQAIAAEAIRSGELARLSEEVIRPHYRCKLALAEAAFDRELPEDLPWHLHLGEGGLFVWLWLQDLPVSDTVLYHRIKREGVLVVPGSFFFPGLEEEWDHKVQCLRVSLTATDEEIEFGAHAIARAVEEAYGSEVVAR